jgi:beta-phosphoglucomutase-like phosphatase (HAD superfamily)
VGENCCHRSERPVNVEEHFLANAKLLHRNENTQSNSLAKRKKPHPSTQLLTAASLNRFYRQCLG